MECVQGGALEPRSGAGSGPRASISGPMYVDLAFLDKVLVGCICRDSIKILPSNDHSKSTIQIL